MTSELKRLLNDLVEKHGETHLSRIHKTEYKSIRKTKRKDALRHLIGTLKESGKEREHFETRTFQDDISKFFFPDIATEGFSKSKVEGGRSVVCNEIDQVVAELWRSESTLSKEIPLVPKLEEPKPEEPRFAGRDINKELYKKDLEFEPQLDEEWAALTGVTKDE